MNELFKEIVNDIRKTYESTITDCTYVDKYEAAYNNAYNTALYWATKVISDGVEKPLDIKNIHHKQADIFMVLSDISKE